MRPSIRRFVEIVDQGFDTLADAAFEFEFIASTLDEETRDDCLTVAHLNENMCEMLLIAFQSLFTGSDLREKTLAVRIYEKRIDQVKFDIIRMLRKREITNFWEGKSLSDFVTSLTSVSDIIEDAFKKQKNIEQKVASLKNAIAELEREIEQRKAEIARLEEDHSICL